MQTAISLQVDGLTLRGMEHIPDRVADEKVPAVILFHGFTGNKLEPHRLFVKLSRAMSDAGIAAFRFDFSGSGESDGNFEDMTVSQEIREAHAILDYVQSHEQIDANHIILLGLSLGGFVAGIVAGDRPSDVERLVLLAPAGNMRDIVTGMARQMKVDLSKPYFDYSGDLVGLRFANDIQTLDGFERARPFDKPVLLIHGTNDETVPYQVSERYQQEVYGGRAVLHLISGADHTFNSQAWETELIQTVCTFVR